ncbi:hypothetical protein [Atopococcus tabaci]|uniref:hypothetical protein n=1 Tax=Atopococcus tabaci TaxID=269774 RepID=UPI002409D57F|nr:hypothetical protein [Atopococcus tabaci]
MFYYRARKQFNLVIYPDFDYKRMVNNEIYLGYDQELTDPEIEARDFEELGQMEWEEFMFEYGNGTPKQQVLSRWDRLSSYTEHRPPEASEKPHDWTETAGERERVRGPAGTHS